MRLRRLGCAAATAAVLGTGLAACGGAGSGGSGGSSAARGQDAQLLVAAAPAKTTDSGSARFALTAATRLLGRSVNFTGNGAFNFTNHSGRVLFALPSALGGQKVTEIVTPTTVYLQIPGLTPAGKYAAVKTSELTGSSSLGQLGNSDPTAALETLRGASHDVRAVGGATVRGTRTTHYSGTIDVQTAVAAAPSYVKDEVRRAFGSVKSLPFDAYIDDQGRLRRFVQHISLPASEATGGQAVSVDSTFDLFGFGTPVQVTAPAKSEIVDGSSLLQQLTRRS
jgi:hypothetical protein